jgi:phosphoribosylformylglycinamidine synthase
MKFGVVVFPGSNCDMDVHHVVANVLEEPVDYVWYEETDLSSYDCLVLPGGFSYGDYLRAGAIAKLAPVMQAIREFAEQGGYVLGICNGFQVLCETGLLPGALHTNDTLKFECRWVNLRVDSQLSVFTRCIEEKTVLRMPIAHAEGNYFVTDSELRNLKSNDQLVMRYVADDARATNDSNPNGSIENIAAVCNEQGNVLGMMPHPERCAEEILGSTDGRLLFECVLREANKAIRA